MEAIKTGKNKLKARLRNVGVACGSLIVLLLSSAADAKPAEMAAPATASLAGDEFDREAAKKTLSAAADRAKGCKMPGGPTGTGKVSVTFAPRGEVESALLVSGPFGGTAVGSCIVRTFRAAKVPPFSGSAVTVAKSVGIS
jgi:hypothetical protein